MASQELADIAYRLDMLAAAALLSSALCFVTGCLVGRASRPLPPPPRTKNKHWSDRR